MFWILYNVVFVPVYLLLLPRFFVRMWRRGGYRRDFGQRFGSYSPEVRDRLGEGGRVWVHAVSVGEVGLALKFLGAWREMEPEVSFVLSVTTSTGYALALKRQHENDVVIYFPVDVPPVVCRVLNLVRPRAVVMVEQEFWPNLLRICRRRNIPTALINGRISDRSFARYMRARFATRRVLPLISRCFVQTAQDAERLREMGAPESQLEVIPSMKYAGDVHAKPELVEGAKSLLRETGLDGAPLLVAGSVWPGEFGVVAAAGIRAGYAVALVPRHFERAEIARMEVEAAGLSVRLRSDEAREAEVLVVNTTGELVAWYALANVVFVGKSLPGAAGKGGQNPIEPAALGKPVVVGPNMRNFPGVMHDFLQAEAIIQVKRGEELEPIFSELQDSQRQQKVGSRAVEVVAANRDTLRRTVEGVRRMLAEIDRSKE